MLNKKIPLWCQWGLLLTSLLSPLILLLPCSAFFCHWFLGNLSLGSDVFILKDLTNFRNTMDHIHGILWLLSSFSPRKGLIVIDSLFFWLLPEWYGYSFGKKEGNPSQHIHRIPSPLPLIGPNGCRFEFHDSRRVKLENVYLNDGAFVFHQKAVIALSILTGYQTSGCRFEEWTLAVGTRLPAPCRSWPECEWTSIERDACLLKGGKE